MKIDPVAWEKRYPVLPCEANGMEEWSPWERCSKTVHDNIQAVPMIGKQSRALYSQATVDALQAEVERWKSASLAQSGYAYEAEARATRAEAEAAALRGDAERWNELCRQIDADEFPGGIIEDARHMGSGALEMHVDAAMKGEGR